MRLELVERRDLERGGAPVVEEGPVAEDAVDDAEVARARARRGRSRWRGRPPRPRRPRPCAGSPRRRGCRRTRPCVFSYTLGLRVAVRLGRAVPVEVVVGEVEARRSPTGAARRARRRQVVQLVARELDDEHVEAAGVAHGVEHGHADVAARRGAQPVRGEERRRELRRSWSCRSCR